MKKLFAILVMMVASLSFTNKAGAQFGSAARLALNAQDTLNTSSSLDTVTKYITATAGYSALGIQLNCTKISGTVSAKAYLYGAMDGTNYNITDSSGAFADGDNYIWFTKVTTPYTSYKIQVRNATGTASTQKVLVRTWYTLRRHD